MGYLCYQEGNLRRICGSVECTSVLNSDRAIKINIQVMRIFVQMRQYVLSQNATSKQIVELRKLLLLHIENTDNKLSKHDKTIEQIIIALNNLIEKPPKTKPIGFNTGN